jgi:hypothetical protein
MLIGFHELSFSRKNQNESTGLGSLFFFLSERGTTVSLVEAKPCLSRKQKCVFFCRFREASASCGSKTVSLVVRKKKIFFFHFERHSHASRVRKKMLFSFSRGMTMPPAKANLCISRKQNRTSHDRKKNKNTFFVFERHGRASRGSKIMPLLVEKKENAFGKPKSKKKNLKT